MRITPFEKETIVREANKWFGTDTRVILFGSRTNDVAKGGDIDLFIVPSSSSDLYMKKIHFLVSLKSDIGEQKVDVVLQTGREDDRLIIDTAQKEGIDLKMMGKPPLAPPREGESLP